MLEQLHRRAAALCALLLLVTSIAVPAGSPYYRVTADERLRHLDVSACFEAPLPGRLTAQHRQAPNLLLNARAQRGNELVELKPQGMSLDLPSGRTPLCVQYRVDLGGMGELRWRADSWRSRDAVVLDPALWLWFPDGSDADGPWRLDIDLPPGYDISAPWRRLDRNRDRVSYEVRRRLPGRDARMAIGRFSVESIELPGGRIRYALLPGEPAADEAVLRQWISSRARALVGAYGRLPVPDMQLLVVPVAHGREPVPWGEVQRGGGDAVHVYINQRLPAQQFMTDWVLIHELSHLLHPLVDSSDRWLSEGIASYYQNVLRARAGLNSAQWAWNRLHAGFQRGIRGTARGRSLAEASETMMRDRSFMRVYWSGAAIALLADVELRRRSSGTQSLDTALAAFGTCCLPSDRSWSARELMHQLDRLTGTTVFHDLYREHVDVDDFPDLHALYLELGLQTVSATRVHLDPTAPAAAIREAIMSPTAG